ncbi:unnamed protein product [Rotaria sp. Silwood2]|nr:unnamed protein product [Rotaria sp. Silwood2]CAF2927959.1 unnamed protein product [Rotaria sp. Silwood2]CAF3188915.1 unnamed protein product [Rotaria sp. Silwood2]CAF3313273.1 unnamed protein product [Rotaria sp. Silwood2]CAF3950305.1 unnamed protein product [Rotaria sp. Silwood2]
MGQLFTRISTQRSEQQTSSINTQNNFIAMQLIIMKGKLSDQEIISNERKILLSDNNQSLPLSPSSQMSKNVEPSKNINTTISGSSPSVIFFLLTQQEQ